MGKVFLNSYILICILVSVSFFGASCQNRIGTVDTTTQEYERNILNDTYILKPYEYRPDEGRMTLQLYENKVTSVKLYENHRTLKHSTPYEAWRELYEVPTGVVIFPIGLATHVLNIFTLGFFPYRWCWAIDCFGLSAMNPFMNIEDSDRVVDEALKNVRELIDQRDESEEILRADTDVTAFVEGKAFNEKTDGQGRVSFRLLKPDGSSMLAGTTERKIRVMAGEKNEAAYEWIVSLAVWRRVRLAMIAIRKYKESPTAKSLAETVHYLEKEGFTEVAYQLELLEIKRNLSDKSFKDEYRKASDKLIEIKYE